MITRSSLTMDMLNADITSLRFKLPLIGKRLTLSCASSAILQSKQLTLGAKMKINDSHVDLILIGEAQRCLCFYDPVLNELRMFASMGLQFHENHIYETASLDTLIDIFFSESDYVEVLRERNEQLYLLEDDAYVVKTPAINNKLGAGVYSDVYMGFFNDNAIAIKKSKAAKTSKSVRFELVILMYIQSVLTEDGVRNDVTVHCYGAGTRYSARDLIFEYMPSTLEKYIVSKECDNELLYTYICDVISALLYLHERCKVVHGDLKPANIFIGPHPERGTSARIGDFGYADTVELPWRRPMIVGSPLFMAPEILADKLAVTTTHSDIYALGITMVNVVTKNVPYPDINTYPELISQVVHLGIMPPISDKEFVAHPKLASASRWCAESLPSKRPTAGELKLEFSTPSSILSQKLSFFSKGNLSFVSEAVESPSRKRTLTQQ